MALIYDTSKDLESAMIEDNWALVRDILDKNKYSAGNLGSKNLSDLGVAINAYLNTCSEIRNHPHINDNLLNAADKKDLQAFAKQSVDNAENVEKCLRKVINDSKYEESA